MQRYSVFDIIGPRMVGPSSSHTAGAARLAYTVHRLAGYDVRRVAFTLYGSFAETGRGHGTDKALIGGIFRDLPLTICGFETPTSWLKRRAFR